MEEIIGGVNAKYYNYVEKLWDSVASLYNYNYLKTNIDILETFNESSKLNDNTKYYFKDNNNLCLINLDNNDFNFAEVISFGFRLLEEMGLDVVIKIDNKKDILNYLELLDVDYEIEHTDNTYFEDFKFNITDINGKSLMMGGKINNSIGLIANIASIVSLLANIHDKRLLENMLDVNIEAIENEEKIVGMRLLQDLRWSDIRSDFKINNEARLTVIINKDKLNKGLLEVKDNITNSSKDIGEDEILDYLISNL